MTSYTGFGTGTPSGLAYGADTGVYSLGTAFIVSSSGLELTKGRLYLDSNGGAVSAADVLGGSSLEFTLYAAAPTSGGATGSPLFTPVTLSSLTMDAWNEFVLPSPYALSTSTVYYAAVFFPAGRYSAKSHEFSSQVDSTPIVFPADGSLQGSSGTVKNGAFESGGAGVQPPTNSFNETWYGIDIEVSSSSTSAAASGTVTATGSSDGTMTSVLSISGATSALGATEGAVTATLPAAGTTAGASASSGDPIRRPFITDPVGSVMPSMLAEALMRLDPVPGRAALYPGAEVAWDECCSGQLWLRVVDSIPTGSGPRTALSQPCGVFAWAVTFGLGMLRCVSTLDDNGLPPTAEQLTTDTLQMTADRAALAQALLCGIGPLVEKLTVLRWDPLGPDGACAGGEWKFSALITDCGCPE